MGYLKSKTCKTIVLNRSRVGKYLEKKIKPFGKIEKCLSCPVVPE